MTWLDKVRAIVQSVIGPLDYLALYRAKVVAQSANMLTLDVTPDDTRIPGMSGIEFRLAPGMRCKVAAGKYVLVGWDGGNPSKPYASPAWDAGSATLELHLDATDIYLQSGTLKNARDTDPVNAGTLTAQTANGLPVLFTHVDARTAVMTSGPSVQLTGKITDGHPHVKS